LRPGGGRAPSAPSSPDFDKDQVIDIEAAQSLSADVGRDHELAAWIIVRDQPQPGAFTARLVTSAPTPYVMVADTLEALRAQLPSGLTYRRQPADPSDLVEVWFLDGAVAYVPISCTGANL
jgi:hypothetical protein